MAALIPAFLNIDVEPDGFQQPTDGGWTGYEHLAPRLDALRERLTRTTGRVPKFGWYLRMDPQIRVMYGDATFAASAFEGQLRTNREHGDVFGVHVHPIRWSATSASWIHDFTDRDLMVECVDHSVSAFAAYFGESPLRFRYGFGVMTNDLVELIDGLGFRVDLTVEPVEPWVLSGELHTGVDSSAVVGSRTDCSSAPLEMYRPARSDFRVKDERAGRELTIVPFTSSRFLPEKPLWWRAARAVRNPPTRQRARVLYPWFEWPSPTFYWDLVDRQLRSIEHPHLSIAVRTDDPSTARRALALLDALPDHPVAQRLEFTDPVTVADSRHPADIAP